AGSGGIGGGVAWSAGTGEVPRASAGGAGYGGGGGYGDDAERGYGPAPGYGTDPGYGGGPPGQRSGSPFDPGYGYTGGPWEDRPAAHPPTSPPSGPDDPWS